LPLGGPQQLAFPMDPATKIIRDGSLLNQVALVRLDPAQLSPDTRADAAGGVVAYSQSARTKGVPSRCGTRNPRCSSVHATRLDSIQPIARASSTVLHRDVSPCCRSARSVVGSSLPVGSPDVSDVRQPEGGDRAARRNGRAVSLEEG